MKFIHCADLHLDSKIETLPTEKTKIRREEILHSFERLIDFAIQNNVLAIIISGDMFDVGKVSIKTRTRVINAIKKASQIDFLYLSGNHDDDNFILSLEELPSNLKLFSDTWTGYRYGQVVISGVKFTNHNQLAVYDTLQLNPSDINIVSLHGQTAMYNSKEKAETISLPRLKNKFIDYLALGHIHSYSVGELDERGKYAYCGCLDGRGFDETGDKGFVLINVENGKLDSQFVKFSSRVNREIEFDLSGYDNWYDLRDQIMQKIAEECNERDLVKLVLVGEHKVDFMLDVEGLTMQLNQNYFFAKVYDKSKLIIEPIDYASDKSVRGEFVRSVLECELDEDVKQKILMCGLNALKGEV